MKKLLLLPVFLVCSFVCYAQETTHLKTHSTTQAFVPKGYFILKQAEGDLNNDGLNDTAIIIAPNWEKDENYRTANGERTLLILLAQPDNTLVFSASKNGFILGKWDGGMMGDPLQDFLIDRGCIVVGIYGGSRNRWGMTYRFRWQNNDWYLIGYTSLSADNLELTSTKIDANFNTGITEITDMVQNKKNKHRINQKLKPINLKTFTPKLAEEAVIKR